MIFSKDKNIWIFSYIFFLIFVGCEDFLDVRPKSEIPANLHFQRESGYLDQLIGVYTQMCDMNMYGKEMSFGLVEVLSQNYDLKANHTYRYVADYDYENIYVKSLIDLMWSSTYNCIANLNLMLQYIDEVDSSIFTGDNHAIYKGEALGLRGFLHFDMLRLYAPAYLSSSSANAIPYVVEYAPSITPQYTVTEVIDFILKDLTEAMDLLEVDPLRSAGIKYENWSRRAYFNYYAVVATLARVYMYKGDSVNALKYAEIIISEMQESNTAYTWTDVTSLTTPYDYEVNRLFTNEMIFYLDFTRMATVIDANFTSNTSFPLTLNETKADAIYERSAKGYGNDWRMYHWFRYDGGELYLSKFWQYENGRYNKHLPLIRMTESYYIAAEVLRTTNPQRSVELLNEVRSHRNLSDFALDYTLLTADDIMEEVKKEYRKEFLGEGQYFYYYKRLNYKTIEGSVLPANNEVYVLPMPDNEIEFGDRK